MTTVAGAARQRLILIPLFTVVLLALGAWYGTHFLARLPIERNLKNSTFWERVRHGADMMYTALYASYNSPEDSPKTTSLPVIELYLNGTKLDALNSALPDSGRKIQNGYVKIDGKTFQAKLRYRGDSINHWMFPAKSWRVELRKGKLWNGVGSFNLVLPRTENQIMEYFGYWMGQQAGVIAPRAFPVHLRINRQFDGMRFFLDQPNQDFLYALKLKQGRLYEGDIDTELLYGNKRRPRLFEDWKAWQLDEADIDRGAVTPDVYGKEPIFNAVEALKSSDPDQLRITLPNLFDIEEELRYMALLDLVGSRHVDDSHNQRFYLDPTTGLLRPIVWDILPYYWFNPKDGVDIGSNLLIRRILLVPEFRERKNKFLWEFVHGPLSAEVVKKRFAEEVEKVKPDLLSMPIKVVATHENIGVLSNAAWEGYVREVPSQIETRVERVKEVLRSIHPTFYLKGESIVVQNPSNSTFRIKEISCGGTKLSENPLDVLVPSLVTLKSDGKRLAPVPGAVEVDIAALLSCVQANVASVAVKGINGVTGETVSAQHGKALEGAVSYNPKFFRPEPTLQWGGEISLSGVTTVDRGTTLTIEPGTRIRLARDSSIIVNGTVIANGTAEKNIIFERADPTYPWGVIGFLRGSKGEFSNVKINGGSEATVNNVYFENVLSAHHASLTLRNVIFANGGIALNDISAIQDNVMVTQGIPSFPLSLANEKAYGTEGRKEREFKFRLDPVPQREEMEQIVLRIIDELNKRIAKGGEQLLAPTVTKIPYKVPSSVAQFAYRDVYLDTPSKDLFRLNGVYRVRNRFKSWRDHENHVEDPSHPAFWQFRGEVQGKFDRHPDADIGAVVTESRFEFREPSEPFKSSPLRVPPPPPWEVTDLIRYAQAGTFKGIPMTPSVALAQFLRKNGINSEYVNFEPAVAALLERTRFHIEMSSKWGSGPNPEQAFLVSFDYAETYPGKEYLAAYGKGMKNVPALSKFMELELEFERNVSDKMDRVAEGKDGVSKEAQAEAEAARKIFLKDYATLGGYIADSIKSLGYNVSETVMSKFEQSKFEKSDYTD